MCNPLTLFTKNIDSLKHELSNSLLTLILLPFKNLSRLSNENHTKKIIFPNRIKQAKAQRIQISDKIIRKAKHKYFHNNFKNSKNPNKTWQIINSLTGRSTDKMNCLTTFFNFLMVLMTQQNVLPNICKKFPLVTNYEKFLSKHSTSFSFYQISDNELVEAVSRLEPKS